MGFMGVGVRGFDDGWGSGIAAVDAAVGVHVGEVGEGEEADDRADGDGDGDDEEEEGFLGRGAPACV